MPPYTTRRIGVVFPTSQERQAVTRWPAASTDIICEVHRCARPAAAAADRIATFATCRGPAASAACLQPNTPHPHSCFHLSPRHWALLHVQRPVPWRCTFESYVLLGRRFLRPSGDPLWGVEQESSRISTWSGNTRFIVARGQTRGH